MRTWAKASTPAALLAVAVMSLGGGTALADTSGDGSIGGGNQIDLPISLPIDISGNSIAAIGSSEASSQGGADVVNQSAGGGSNRTSGNASILGGNQITAPISAPINACGNALSLIGSSDAGCKGGATVRNQGRGGAGGNRTSGDASVLGGNQVVAPISAPINACGNAVAIFGGATAGCKGGATVRNQGRGGAGGNRTSGDASVLGGNQIIAPISLPVNICGNAVAAVGRAFAGCKGGASVTNGGPGRAYQSRHMAAGSSGNDTDGRFGAGSGNQVIAPISLPVDVCGNAVGNAIAGCSGGAAVENGGSGAGGNRTSGQAGVLSGNQVIAPITAPINVCGNAAAVLGRAFAGCKGGAHVKNAGRGAGGNHTSGQAGVLSGNQIVAPITAPINVCGNAAAVLGDAAAGCLGGANPGRAGHGSLHQNGRLGVLGKPVAAKGALLPMLPVVPALGGLQSLGNVTHPVQGAGMNAQPFFEGTAKGFGEASKSFGLPHLPELPGLGQSPILPKHLAASSPTPKNRPVPERPDPVLEPATDLLGSTPVGDTITSTAESLPLAGLGLMSAAQPAGVTGMNANSLLALVLGSMFAVSATLFATARRFRFGRK
ncbi:chaplin [Nonomuraea sp. K274]|uniref:Chaplin n=1 Tax=Nonomuraea cypriaca TaxID=1187855 RepID=A0A931EZP3_9ACTN|nr:chaplin [Nonomuraea cypriaca]MBF8186381.1 chaplin [Nonomuraea cypriaca]